MGRGLRRMLEREALQKKEERVVVAKVKCLLCGMETELTVGTEAVDWTCSNCGLVLHSFLISSGSESPVVQYKHWTRRALEFKARQDAKALLETADWLAVHAEAFPDLYQHTNRWEKKRWASKHANSLVTACDISHNCGCCGDSPLEVWPFCEVDGQRIYSDPPVFTVGEKSYSARDNASSGWARRLRDVGISECVILQVKAFFGKQLAERRAKLEAELAEATDEEERTDAQAELEALAKPEDEL